uniref:Holin n=1 Tax=viral metagenome TaxID=1070528 RepID=A0A6M3XYV2_9ZZZZ
MDGLTSFIVLVALTTGITEVCKRALSLESKFMPLVALISGLGLTFIGNVTDLTSLTILTGVAVGLSAAGLFDQTKLFKK